MIWLARVVGLMFVTHLMLLPRFEEIKVQECRAAALPLESLHGHKIYTTTFYVV